MCFSLDLEDRGDTSDLKIIERIFWNHLELPQDPRYMLIPTSRNQILEPSGWIQDWKVKSENILIPMYIVDILSFFFISKGEGCILYPCFMFP